MKWSIKKVPSIKSSIYAKKLNISRILANVLINRGIGITVGNNLINNPELLIEDASNIVNATLVAEKIENSLNKNNHFIIHGDYDVDGLTSSYIITDFLRKLGEEVELYIPERKTGYGLKQKWCNDIINNSLNNDTNYIVITVDCGITANQEIQSLLDNNIEVIVTDHHEPKEAIPNCLCSDPWMDKLSGGHHLCGAGVIWKICSLINQNIVDVNDYLPYVALGTVADVMSMTPENIAIVKLGLEEINKGNGGNINLLMKYNSREIKNLNAENISWDLAPQINACGRMGEVTTAKNFFFADDESTVIDLIHKMIELNDKRSSVTKSIMQEVSTVDYSDTNICMYRLSQKDAGIAGIIAGKLCDANNKPAFVYVLKPNVITYSCSMRSTGNIDFVKILNEELDNGTIKSWGGHANACGVELYSNKIEEFEYNVSLKAIDPKYILEEQEIIIPVDCTIKIKDLNTKLYNEVSSLPYDKDIFSAPIFCLENIKVKAYTPYKSNKNHLALDCVDSNGSKITLVIWDGANKYMDIIDNANNNIDIIGTIKTVGFYDVTCSRKTNDITLNILDIKGKERQSD